MSDTTIARNRGGLVSLTITSAAHMLNDMYSNFLPQLLPFLLVVMPGFTATQAAILVASFNISSSLFQPIFGFFVDAKGRTWLIYLGTLWMSFFLSLTGVAGSFPLMALLAATAGLGTSAFHPPASSLVNGLSVHRKAVYQSLFVSAGNLGFALAPLLLVPLFQAGGLTASTLLWIPGVVAAALLFFFLPKIKATPQVYTWKEVANSIFHARRDLAVVLGVIALRSASYTGLLTLLPLFFHAHGVSQIDSGRLTGLMLLTGAVGGLIGGWLSDRWGRKPVIVGSLIAASLLFWGFLLTSGATSVVLLGLAGAALLANFSVTIVAAQETLPHHKAMATGLSMGFANGIGALAVVGIGGLADHFGLFSAVGLAVSLPLLAGILSLIMRNTVSDRQKRAQQRPETNQR